MAVALRWTCTLYYAKSMLIVIDYLRCLNSTVPFGSSIDYSDQNNHFWNSCIERERYVFKAANSLQILNCTGSLVSCKPLACYQASLPYWKYKYWLNKIELELTHVQFYINKLHSLRGRSISLITVLDAILVGRQNGSKKSVCMEMRCQIFVTLALKPYPTLPSNG